MVVGDISQAVFKKNQLPACVGRCVCNCFDELFYYDGSFDNMADYTRRVKHQLEYFLYTIQTHVNKEELIRTPEMTKIRGFNVRDVLYYADLTRIHFTTQVRLNGNCEIQLPSKKCQLQDFLKCVEKLYHAWDLSIFLFFSPESALPLTSLKIVLESHHELIQIFERYCQSIIEGISSPITSSYGIQNLYHLFY